MRKIDWKSLVIGGLIVALVVLAWRSETIASTGGVDNNGEMIAVTGQDGNGTSVLYVIDTKSKSLAVYRSVNGTGVEFVAARRIAHDLKLVAYRDRTPEEFHPLNLEKGYRRFAEGRPTPAEAEAGAAEKPTEPAPGAEKREKK